MQTARLLLRNATRNYYTVNSTRAQIQNDTVAKQLTQQIKATGPITVAEYMRHVLIHPLGGYYTQNKREVFGAGGDFVTSPELCQVFGEMVAVWFVNEWSRLGAPKPLQLVELGPGRGTLTQDILRVFKHFNANDNMSIHFVEISEALSDQQARRLCIKTNVKHNENLNYYRDGQTIDGIDVKWYKHLSLVPNAFTLFIAHEFFDALPVHKFQRVNNQYREILIDYDFDSNKFRYRVAQQQTPSALLIKENESRQHVEVSPDSLTITQEIARRLDEHGGLALIIDYGHDGDGEDTFRAFKQHQLHDPLVDPGSADLTADVDFNRIKEAAVENDRVIVYGPTTQRDFLLNMGIEHRVERLKESIKDEKQRELLQSAYGIMIDEDKMGRRFKCLAMLPGILKTLLKNNVPTVAGF